MHHKRSYVAALDESGVQLLSRRIVNDPQTALALLDDVGEGRIALEATHGWEWLADGAPGGWLRAAPRAPDALHASIV